MLRRTIIRIMGLLLVANGLAGTVAAWVGWQAADQLFAGLEQASTALPPEQARLVGSIREVTQLVDDAATAADGFAHSMGRAHDAISGGSQIADDLGGTFEHMGTIARTEVLGERPLGPLSEPFTTSAGDFRRLSRSLADVSDALANNARDTARVAEDLRGIDDRLTALAAEAEAFRPVHVIREGLRGLDLGIRLLLGLVVLEAVASFLTGAALLLLAGGRQASRGTTAASA